MRELIPIKRKISSRLLQVTGRIKIARARQIDVHDLSAMVAGALAQNENAIGQLHGLLDIVSDKEDGLALGSAKCA